MEQDGRYNHRLECNKDNLTWATRNRVYGGGNSRNKQRYELKQNSYQLTVHKFRRAADPVRSFGPHILRVCKGGSVFRSRLLALPLHCHLVVGWMLS